MPAAFMSFSNPAKSPLTMRSRCGYVWLPIGRPSGLAEALVAPAARNAASAASVAVFLKNSRLFIALIASLLFSSGDFVPRTPSHARSRGPHAPLRSRGSLAALARDDIEFSPWPLADGVASCHEIVIIE